MTAPDSQARTEAVDPAAGPATVFVYGTLMPGERNAAVAHAAGEPQAQEPATLDGHRLYDLHPEGYPALLADPEGGPVRGWVLHYRPAVWSAALAHLDDLEGLHLQPPLYLRRLVQARTGAGALCPAWVYLYARSDRLRQPGFRPVSSGDWTALNRR